MADYISVLKAVVRSIYREHGGRAVGVFYVSSNNIYLLRFFLFYI